MLFDIEVTTADGVTILSVLGELDVATAPKLRQEIVRLVSEAVGPPRLVIDLAGVDFLDSTGLGVLLGGLKRVRARDGALVLCRAESQVRRVFEVTRVIEILPMHEGLDDAVATASGSAG